MANTKVNVYQDHDSGGWVREVFAVGGWYVVGVYGSREAALRSTSTAPKRVRRCSDCGSINNEAGHYGCQYPSGR